MSKDNEHDEFIQKLGGMLTQLKALSEQSLQLMKPEVEWLITTNSKDVERITHVLDRLFNLVLSGVGEEQHERLLQHLETIDPELASEIRDLNDDLLGKYDDAIIVAAQLAKELHQGQVDKAGVDYFKGHLTTVGEAGFGWQDKIVGYLHDAAEDTPYSVEQIVEILAARCGDSISPKKMEEIKEALELLNSKTASSREEYIARISKSKIATRVKINDLTHNMDISRIPNPTEKDFERIERYKKEYRRILGYLGPVEWE